MDEEYRDIVTSKNDQIDKLEASMLANFPVADAPVRNIFAQGMYAREMFVPIKEFDGVFLTSEIHKTEHFFHLTKGSLIVSDGISEPVLMKAPYLGITKPGTRRIALALEDVVWTTFHPNPDNESVEQIRERIIEKHDNPYITDEMRQRMLAVKKRVQNVSSLVNQN
jgi:hypothetical protein